jgi:hypothetical protein
LEVGVAAVAAGVLRGYQAKAPEGMEVADLEVELEEEWAGGGPPEAGGKVAGVGVVQGGFQVAVERAVAVKCCCRYCSYSYCRHGNESLHKKEVQPEP